LVTFGQLPNRVDEPAVVGVGDKQVPAALHHFCEPLFGGVAGVFLPFGIENAIDHDLVALSGLDGAERIKTMLGDAGPRFGLRVGARGPRDVRIHHQSESMPLHERSPSVPSAASR
jgi:hypothetical protein